ncbi:MULTISPECIES: hypothetical protein [Microbacterium]|uniref:Uncharacterized protein n=1 Tax=Microbacterium oxydans TaxID=82380 RepID=A0A3Q9J3C3_9MICO|nr:MULTISPECIES: hypothetical protein [Microbacterium]AZS40286.1 hypothetical protein CVS54_01612 [Microbacterium oxydans]KAB1891383.1 hypothetical protein F6W69_12570 [Microbacterium oxydans]KKX96751.1 hypothetical protein AAY78_15695 [Microbacterium sp. Ag1]GED38713.1 hypothetical protein MOX01_18550 [Microbacterium oxydans]
MSNPIIPPLPPILHDDEADVPTKDVDGERVLDPDADDALVDSAEADRIAAGADEDDTHDD